MSSSTKSSLTRRDFLATSTAVLGASALSAHAEKPDRPNILLICTDQQHWQALGCMDPSFSTPNLDKLAAQSTHFTEAFCTTPQCSASRSSLYTGYYPHRTTVIGNIGSLSHEGDPIEGLPTHFETLGSLLQKAGYHTGYIGKWHLAQEKHFSQHFDEAELKVLSGPKVSNKSIAFLKERAKKTDQPFLLCANYLNPHDIYQFSRIAKLNEDEVKNEGPSLPESWKDDLETKPAPQLRFMQEDQGARIYGKPQAYWRQYRALYREKCRMVDEQIGKLLDALEEQGLKDNTIIVFTSDHGDMDAQHRLIFKGPFMYEHMLRVPLIMHVPKRYGGKGGERMQGFSVLTDVVPTLCDFAQATAPKDLEGHSLRGVLTQESPMPKRDYVVTQYYNKQRWVNPIRSLRSRKHKYNRYIRYGEELYDLETDPLELNNCAEQADKASIQEELAGQLKRWMQAQSDTAFDNYCPTDRENRPLKNKD